MTQTLRTFAVIYDDESGLIDLFDGLPPHALIASLPSDNLHHHLRAVSYHNRQAIDEHNPQYLIDKEVIAAEKRAAKTLAEPADLLDFLGL